MTISALESTATDLANYGRRLLAAADHYSAVRDRLPDLAPIPGTPEYEDAAPNAFWWKVVWASETIADIVEADGRAGNPIKLTVATFYNDRNLTPLPTVMFDAPDTELDSRASQLFGAALARLTAVATAVEKASTTA